MQILVTLLLLQFSLKNKIILQLVWDCEIDGNGMKKKINKYSFHSCSIPSPFLSPFFNPFKIWYNHTLYIMKYFVIHLFLSYVPFIKKEEVMYLR